VIFNINFGRALRQRNPFNTLQDYFCRMQINIPYSKIIRIAILTTPLFGVLGATPMMFSGNPEFSLIVTGFLVVYLVTLLFWGVNILLLRIMYTNTGHGHYLLRYLFSTLISLILVYLLVTYLYPVQPIKPPGLMSDPPGGFHHSDPLPVMPLIQALSINIIVIILMELVLLRERKQVIESENIQLRINNLEARHSQLLQQLHPHFLFNSLNTLRSLIHRDPDQAESYLIKLSDILRSTVNIKPQTLVPLAQELERCINYLHLQQMRFGDALQFSIDIPEHFRAERSVPVYSIQLLTENAIKHNILTTTNPLHIRISTNTNGDSITVTNNLQQKNIAAEKSGAGLANLTERYRLLGARALDIRNGNGSFEVTIQAL